MSYENQSIDLWSKSMDWFLYDIGLRHEKVNTNFDFHIFFSEETIKIVKLDTCS